MAPIDAARGAAGAHTALGLILMLLTQLLSASPLAVPQLTSTTSTTTSTTTTTTRRDSITVTTSSSAAGRSNSNSNHPHQQQPQLIRKITNWSEKPPDTIATVPRSDFGPPMQKQTKDLLIPLKSHFESFIKRNKSSSSRSVISRRSRNLQTNNSNNNNTDNNLNVYFEKSFVAINDTTNESNVDSVDSSEQSYSNPIRLHSDTGSAYFNDASILEAKKYNALLQHYKNDKSTTNRQRNHEFSHEMYQILSTTNNQQTQTELNQKLSHDFSIKLGKYTQYTYTRMYYTFFCLCLTHKISRKWQLEGKRLHNYNKINELLG